MLRLLCAEAVVELQFPKAHLVGLLEALFDESGRDQGVLALSQAVLAEGECLHVVKLHPNRINAQDGERSRAEGARLRVEEAGRWLLLAVRLCEWTYACWDWIGILGIDLDG